jgi:MFS transporter, FSR family, fosmidomycin resistance protein
MNTLTAQRSWQSDAEVIMLVGLAHATSHFFQLLLPPLFPWLIAQFGLSYTQAGLMMTVFFLFSGVGQALAGFVVDRLGAPSVLLFGLGCLALAALLLATASSYGALMVVAAVAGTGNSIFHPTDFSLLNQRVSAPRLGHAFSAHGLAGNLGWTAGAMFMAGVAAAAGWHAAALGAAALAATVFGVIFVRRRALFIDEPPPPRSKAGHRASGPGSVGFLASSAVWLCFVFFFLATGAFSVLQNFGPTLLGRLYGVSHGFAAGALSAYLLGSAAGTVAGGFIASRSRNNEATIALALGVSAVLAVWLAVGGVPTWGLMGLLAMMGFGGGVAGPNRDLLVRRAATARFGASAYGRVYGFVYSGLDAGMAVTPLLFGRLLDQGLFRAALLGIAVFQVGALGSALQVGRGDAARTPGPAGGEAGAGSKSRSGEER